MPLLVERKKKKVFEFVKDKLKQHLLKWKDGKLSRAEKEILLKMVTQSLPTYIMSLYQLLDGLCNELHKLMNGFWCNGGRNSGIR